MGLLKDSLRLNEDVVVKKLHKIAPMLEIFTINFYICIAVSLYMVGVHIRHFDINILIINH